MSTAALQPQPPSGPGQPAGPGKFNNAGRQRHQANLRKYGLPLPIVLPVQPHPKAPRPFLSAYLPTFLTSSSTIEVPTCTGVYDALTRSVWVTDPKDIEILFRRGFFGKGTLSRSEPTWKERRVDMLRGGDCECGVMLYVGL